MIPRMDEKLRLQQLAPNQMTLHICEYFKLQPSQEPLKGSFCNFTTVEENKVRFDCEYVQHGHIYTTNRVR